MVTTAAARRPYRVGFLLVDGFALLSYASAIEPLRAANQLAGETLYLIDHLAANDRAATSSSGAVIDATMAMNSRRRFDAVFVVAGGDPISYRDDRVFRWLRRLGTKGTQLGGISGGPVILALAGLMDGRRMTVHWEHAEALSEVVPDLLVERSLYVRDRDRATCAGGTAPLDMMHALVTEQSGPDFARRVSDWFMHTEVRPSGGPQRAGLAERYGINNLALINAIEAMENHIADPLSLNQLALLAGLSKRQLNRLFIEKVNVTTMAFYRRIRLAKAATLLTQSPLSITEIGLATGFASSAHLSDCFRREYHVTPSSMRKGSSVEAGRIER